MVTPPGNLCPEVFFLKRRTEWTTERPCEVLDPSNTDPQGMYTGVPENPWERPVQDADDL